MLSVFNISLNVLLFLYSIPLGGIFVLYNGIISLERRTLIVNLVAFSILVLFAVYHHNLIDIQFILDYPFNSWDYYVLHGIVSLLNYQFEHYKQLYTHGVFIVLLLPLGLKLIVDYRIFMVNCRRKSLFMESKTDINIDKILIGKNGMHPVYISNNELNQHCLVIGTTGAGKTTTILNFVEHAAIHNLPCIYMDGKGDIDLVNKLHGIATKYNRVLKVFTLRPSDRIPELSYYNPLSSGNATEWKNRIMSLFAQAEGKGQEHFSLIEQNYINFVSNVLYELYQQTNQSIDLKVLLSALEHKDFLLNAATKFAPAMKEKLIQLYDSDVAKQMSGDVVKLLELFIYSNYGYLFDTSGKSTVINISESITNNELVLFLFDAAAYGEDTKKVAKMVINDINSSFAGFDKFTRAYCIFDEFASYASGNLADSISLQRSKGMHAIIGTQSITSVKLKSLETKRVAEDLIACCNTYIIQKINHVDDAQLFANVMGTRETIKYSSNIYDQNSLPSKKVQENARIIGSTQIVEEFKINPQKIKELRQGEAIIYRKAAEVEPVKIKVNQINI